MSSTILLNVDLSIPQKRQLVTLFTEAVLLLPNKRAIYPKLYFGFKTFLT
jgi:hypothetical protein